MHDADIDHGSAELATPADRSRITIVNFPAAATATAKDAETGSESDKRTGTDLAKSARAKTSAREDKPPVGTKRAPTRDRARAGGASVDRNLILVIFIALLFGLAGGALGGFAMSSALAASAHGRARSAIPRHGESARDGDGTATDNAPSERSPV